MKAYRELLLPGHAVYATPENLEKYKADENKSKTEDAFSSPFVNRVKLWVYHKLNWFLIVDNDVFKRITLYFSSILLKSYFYQEREYLTIRIPDFYTLFTIIVILLVRCWFKMGNRGAGQHQKTWYNMHVKELPFSAFKLWMVHYGWDTTCIVTCLLHLQTIRCLSNLVLQITMSKLESWTLEPWHVRASFRKAGFVVPEHTIQMPPVEIKGPDLTLQEKEFYVTVTVSWIFSAKK